MEASLKLHPLLAEMVGKTISGRYEIVGILGHGGMSAVFAGRHLTLGTDLAIKALHPQISHNAEVAGRFDREAKVASVLEHANCCRVTDFGTTINGIRYMVMPMLRGVDLRSQLGRPMDAMTAVNYTMQILRGLRHAHSHGVVHRDMKPENLIVVRDQEGRPVIKITDFGITKILRGNGADQALTTIGMIPGTPEYMSPEHARGKEIDGRADLYGAGLILFEMLAGKPAYWHDNPREVMRMQVFAPIPELPTELQVPAGVRDFMRRLLAKNPDHRFSDAQEALQAIEPLVVALKNPGALATITTPAGGAAPIEDLPPDTFWHRLRGLFGRKSARASAA
jgi:serine/threonine protein kinase